jgi:2-dehydropantoate 2-reductase
MRIVVIGAGAVGGYFGARLANAGHEVALVARGAHLAAIRERGLRVLSPLGDVTVRVPAGDDPSAYGPADVVLVCVKAYDTESASAGILPLVGADTAVVSLQNGVDNEEKLAAVLGAEHVVGGAAFIFSTTTSPGVVVHTGGPARIVFGEPGGERSPRLVGFLDACTGAGISAGLTADIRGVLWMKFAFICATAGMTAAVRLPLGDICAGEPSWGMFRRLFAEVVGVARAEGVRLTDDDVERQLAFVADLPPTSYSSLHHDLTTGRRMELEALHGTVVRRAARHGVAVPANEAVYAILEPWARRNAGQGGAGGIDPDPATA